ncbi:DUF3624 domain-containing protein [Shewanella ulleungensis]|uniref:DUF3624 domain-containing protein n=1 Tax=Shewanella ulleungensis TaxID=2282699 RepID=A0ABQ2QC35_9GAMM|nr:DUF3624 domain-containing protein [Shewanella ulleungensis]MCL1149193.1 DUF3624 domain-containing protein [Shewanella ulleungensis]GGP72995.1 hypothetical protein GCM10009410_00540 [Shewanella ulleungensis]
MACNQCSDSIFKQKIGRCKRCMLQLTILSLLTWPIWWYYFAATPKVVESIALLFFAISFSGLLILHLLVWLYRRINANE